MHNLSLSFDMSAEHFNASALKDSISFKATYQLADALSIRYLKCSSALNFSLELFFFSLFLENLICEVLLFVKSSCGY